MTTKRLLVMACITSALVAAPASAQDRMARTLAAPPADILDGTLRRPDPLTLGSSSSTAAIPFVLIRQPNGTWSTRLAVTPGDPQSARILVAAPDVDDWRITLSPGETTPITLNAETRDARLTAHRGQLGIPGIDSEATLFEVRTDETEWTIEIRTDHAPSRANGRHDGVLLMTSDHPATLRAAVDGPALVNEPVHLHVEMYDRVLHPHRPGDPPPPLMNAVAKTSSVKTPSRGGQASATQWHPEMPAGLSTLTFSEPGIHRVSVDVDAELPDGHRVFRTVSLLVPVTDARAAITGASSAQDGDAIRIDLALEDARLPDHFLAAAEVWGMGDAGPEPVCWIGGMTTSDVRNGVATAPLSLHPDWLAHSGARAPFELRRVRLEEPDHHVVFAEVERLPIELPDSLVIDRNVERISPEMLRGSRDTARSIPAPSAADAGSLSASRDFGAHNLLLVHGYCAGGNPWPVGNFSGALEIFSDANQTRSNDQFALLLGALGDQAKSFGVVAHSQGGCASLHLYTYYWSGLDWARGGRLIQSLGTPYQGTALAGNLAGIGEIFGAGCGENYDLTYDGAAAWLSGIPTWARQAVNFHTTSFEDQPFVFDYCSLATDFFLTDPEDGVTEQWAGQLPGGINRGHVTGWCHTTDMQDPAQYFDSSRNSTMNQAAAR